MILSSSIISEAPVIAFSGAVLSVVQIPLQRRITFNTCFHIGTEDWWDNSKSKVVSLFK
jgi:hypothetical protein